MPPGTWCEKTSICSIVVMPRLSFLRSRTPSQYSAMRNSSSRSMPVSYGDSLSAATIISTAGWELPNARATDGGVDDVGARLDGLEVVHGRHTTDVVAVDVDRQPDLLLERPHHLLGAERREHARHVLDADGVGAQLLERLRVLDEGVERVHRAHGVGDGAFEQAAALLDRRRAHLDVADVVERVEHAEVVDAVALGRVHEARGRCRRSSAGSRRGSGRAAASAAASWGSGA